MRMDVMEHTSDVPSATAGAFSEVGFAAILRERTHVLHREAERAGFVADLLHGRATRAGYAIYLRNLLPMYEAMEDLIGAGALPSERCAFGDPRLARAEALRRDLRTLGNDRAGVILPEAAAYAAAVEASGAGLVGHAYARYLGDLSGGQILKPFLARSLGLAPDQLSFYDFPGVDIAACKASLRSALDTVAPGSPDAACVVDAAMAAFRHTIAVAQAVSASATLSGNAS